MIDLNFYWAASLYLTVVLSAALFFWLSVRQGKDKDLSLDPKFIWFCSICSYAYINTKEEIISACPRCGSFNKK